MAKGILYSRSFPSSEVGRGTTTARGSSKPTTPLYIGISFSMIPRDGMDGAEWASRLEFASQERMEWAFMLMTFVPCLCSVEVFTCLAFPGVSALLFSAFRGRIPASWSCIDGIKESSSSTKGPWIWIVFFSYFPFFCIHISAELRAWKVLLRA